jgi:sugar lactone lactonase YvrE
MGVAKLQPEIVLPVHAELGEGPIWDVDTNTLVFVDIKGGAVHRFDPASGAHSAFDAGGLVATVVLDSDGDLVLARERTFARCRTDGSDLVAFGDFAVQGELRFNDGAVDPWGRLVMGTMDLQYTRPIGALHRLDVDGTVTQLLDGITLSNGIEWTADATRMYYVDSGTQSIDVFDLHDDGELGARHRIVTMDEAPGGPDGLTLDAEGCIWVACWNRSYVRRYTPDGRLDTQVDFPVSAVTSVAFGGPALDQLFVTTAQPIGDAVEPHAGDLFVIHPGVSGLPPHRFGG